MPNTMHVLLILDKSGSMVGKEADVVGGFNSYIAKLREDTATEYAISVLLFDTHTKKLFSSLALADVRLLTRADFQPSGTTALYDAIGAGIETMTKAVQTDDKPLGDGNVIVVIMTDGEENSSKTYNDHTITQAIELRTAAGWQFVYLGQNLDAARAASRIGIARGNTLRYGETVATFNQLAVGTQSFAVASTTARAGGQSMTTDHFADQYLQHPDEEGS